MSNPIESALMRLDRPAHRVAIAVALAASIDAACGSAGAPVAPAATQPRKPSAGAQRIEVSLTDGLRIEPAEIVVPAGVPVTFVVTNTGATDH